MPQSTGYIQVFEVSNAPVGAIWQVCLMGNNADEVAVTTENPHIAKILQLAWETHQAVRVTYDEGKKIISQVRLTAESL